MYEYYVGDFIRIDKEKDIRDKINLKHKIEAEDTVVYQLADYRGISINDKIYSFKNMTYLSSSNYGILMIFQGVLKSFSLSDIKTLKMIQR